MEVVLCLPAKAFGDRDLPASPLQCDRKGWSHTAFFTALGVGLDPGNWVLFLMFQFLAGVIHRPHWSYKRFSVKAMAVVDAMSVENMFRPLKLTGAKLSDIGDILEAVGGICHPWSDAATVMVV